LPASGSQYNTIFKSIWLRGLSRDHSLSEKRIAVIADEYVATAFKIIGVESYVVKNAGEAALKLRELLKREDIGIIFVASEFFDSKEVEDIVKLAKREKPEILVSKLPTPRNPGKPIDMRKKLLQALGIG